MIGAGEPPAPVLGRHLDAAEADPVVGVRRDARAAPGDPTAVGDAAARRSPTTLGACRRRGSARRTRGHATPAGTACRRRGSPAPTRGPRRNVRSADSASTAATAGFPSARSAPRPTATSYARPIDVRRRRERQHRVGPAGGGGGRASAAASRDGPATGATTRSGNSANAAHLGLARRDPQPRRRAGRHRLAGDDVGDAGSSPARRPTSGATTQTPSPHAVQTPSTSVIAGPPDGPVSPGQHAADDHPLSDDMRAQSAWACAGRRHARRLGWARPLAPLASAVRNRRNW